MHRMNQPPVDGDAIALQSKAFSGLPLKSPRDRQERSLLKLQHRKKLEKTEAIPKEIAEPKRQAFEEKWKAAYPKALPVNRHRGEKEILFQKLNEDEQIFLIVGGRFGRELAQAKIGNGFRYGIAVATDQRVLFLDKGLFFTRNRRNAVHQYRERHAQLRNIRSRNIHKRHRRRDFQTGNDTTKGRSLQIRRHSQLNGSTGQGPTTTRDARKTSDKGPIE